MARCPQCGYKLQLIDVKAECPVCKVNIPNYKWEERLDEDAVNAASGFASFSRKTTAIKSSLFGTKQRIARFVLTFAPLLFFLFPMVTVNAALPFSQGTKGVSMLSIILAIVNGNVDIGSMINFMKLPVTGTAFTVLYVALVLVLLGIVAGVLNFFVLIISGFGYHTKANITLCSLSIVFFIGAVVCAVVSSSMFAAAAPEVMTVKLSYSLFIGLAFFVINLVMNIIARKSLKPERAASDKKYAEELRAALS